MFSQNHWSLKIWSPSFYFLFLKGMIHSPPSRWGDFVLKVCNFLGSDSIKESGTSWTFQFPQNWEPSRGSWHLAPGRLKLFRQQQTKIISSCTPSFSRICYGPNCQPEQKFCCSFTVAASSELRNRLSLCFTSACQYAGYKWHFCPLPWRARTKGRGKPVPWQLCPKGKSWAC